MKQVKRPGMPEARLAAMRLLLLPEKYEEFSDEEREFIRSDLVGQLLNGEWPLAFNWTSNLENSKWILTLTVKPQ